MLAEVINRRTELALCQLGVSAATTSHTATTTSGGRLIGIESAAILRRLGNPRYVLLALYFGFDDNATELKASIGVLDNYVKKQSWFCDVAYALDNDYRMMVNALVLLAVHKTMGQKVTVTTLAKEMGISRQQAYEHGWNRRFDDTVSHIAFLLSESAQIVYENQVNEKRKNNLI